MNFKQESIFQIKYYITNGFTIWFYILSITWHLRYISLICGFRLSLPFENLMWPFFVPIFCQAIFSFRKIRLSNPERDRHSKDHLLGILVFTFSAPILIISYVFFAGSVILIIGEDIPSARNKSINFEEFDKEMYFAGLFLTFIPPILERIKKYYRDRNIFQESEFYIFKIDKVAITCLAFALSMSLFALHSVPIELKTTVSPYTAICDNHDLIPPH